jgi:cell division protein ZapE
MSPSLQPQSASPLDAYEQCVREGKLKDDEAQRLVISRLQLLYQEICKSYDFCTRFRFLLELFSPFTDTFSLLRRMASAAIPKLKPRHPRSIYIWGDVGRGKSLLMNMFYTAIPWNNKRRIHFHAFMQEVHSMIYAWRNEITAKHLQMDLLGQVARNIHSEYGAFICLDELEVTDVADAMILSKLFTLLLEEGVVFIITSNRPPEELYIGGLQRESFMEFVHLAYERMDVLELASPHDYRMQQIKAMQAVYMWPQSKAAETAINDTLAQLTHRAKLVSTVLEVQGRKLTIAKTYGGIARLTFSELCKKPLGSADYLAIARRFHTVFLLCIPKLSTEKRNEARRFVTLVDTLYDHRVKLICTADVAPDKLYTEGDGAFEFARTVSRLAEMQSQQYLGSAHIP